MTSCRSRTSSATSTPASSRCATKLAPHAHNRRNTDLCADKTLLTAFYQPSTRTRMSTEAAMHRLGGHVLGFSDAKMTRAGDFYQESIKDTVHMLEYYGDVIAMRHFQQGAPAEAAKYSSVPIINCGDGWGEHPTQVLTDLYTIWRERGTLDGLRCLCVGDMRMRTMHSIGYAATQFDMELDLVYPPDMAPDRGVQAGAARPRTCASTSGRARQECIDKADVIYIEPVVQADYTKSRVDAADAKKGLTPPEYKVTARADARRRPRRTPSCCTRCRAWTSCPWTWTAPATPATGSRRSTASCCAWR